MVAFLQLLMLAHLVGDFPLQTDTIYDLKQKSYRGVILHVAICTIVNFILLSPFMLSIYTWAAMLFLAVYHFTLDRTKIMVTLLRAKDGLGYFLLDQALHFLSLFIVAYWLDKLKVGPGLDAAQVSRVIMMNGLVAAAFATPPILFYIQGSMKKLLKLHGQLEFPNAYERMPGCVARFIATLGVINGGWSSLLIVVAIIIPWTHPQSRTHAAVYKRIEMIVNVVVCIAAGLWVRWLIL